MGFVHHGGRLVDASSDAGDHALDGVDEVSVVAEANVGELDLAAALDEDLVEAIDQHVGNRGVVKQRFFVLPDIT